MRYKEERVKTFKPSAYEQKYVPLKIILLYNIYCTEQYVWHVQHAIVQAPGLNETDRKIASTTIVPLKGSELERWVPLKGSELESWVHWVCVVCTLLRYECCLSLSKPTRFMAGLNLHPPTPTSCPFGLPPPHPPQMSVQCLCAYVSGSCTLQKVTPLFPDP